jgi:uncharacterized NAD(P)/FAD-binding protein YdhS
VVVVIGGGASGTLTVVHLLRGAAAYGVSPEVVLVDRDGRHGLGQAYATADPLHLLNACAAKMSAVAGDPDHLLRWARGAGLDATGSDFLPRPVYGRYLRELLGAAGREALSGGRLAQVTGTVTAVATAGPGRPLRVRLSGGGGIEADAVVLATGNRAPAPWPEVAAGHRHVTDPWAPGVLAGIRDGAPVLVVGTGLTMVDVAVTLSQTNPDAVVYAVSRHGLLPRPHRCPPAPPAEVVLPGGVLRLPDLLATVRAAIRDRDGEWHGVVDALRPHVPGLWARLGVEDRRRFLALVARYWEVHRHRIPPATASRVAGLQASGRLNVLRGRLVSATAGRDDLTVRLENDGATRELRVGWLVNGTGPGSDVAGDPLLRDLFLAGLARPDALRLGLDADENGAVLDATGRPHERIFTLGPTLRGVRYETIAIPEIRDQAAALAPRLLQAIVRPESARLRDGRTPMTSTGADLPPGSPRTHAGSVPAG